MTTNTPTEKDEELIALLRANAREPVATLARKLGLSRTTVQDRLRRLEQKGVIKGYTVRLDPTHEQTGIRAFVTISVEARRAPEVARALQRQPRIEALYSVSGKYDLVALVRADNAEQMDRLLDEIGMVAGVVRTESAVILSTRLDRR